MKIIHTEIFEIKDFEKFKKLNFIKKRVKEKDFTGTDFEFLYTERMDSVWDSGVTHYSESWEKIEESEED